MELKKNWNSNGNIAGGDRLQLLGFCLGQTDSTRMCSNNTCIINLPVYLVTCEEAHLFDFFFIPDRPAPQHTKRSKVNVSKEIKSIQN